MIISQYTRPARHDELDRLINQIVKDRFNKMTNETIDELDRVIECLNHIRQLYKPFLIDVPDLDIQLKRQIVELKRINEWIKKEVE